MAKTIKNPTWLADTMYNCSLDCTRNDNDLRYAKGIFVGAIGAIMAVYNVPLKEAINLARLSFRQLNRNAVPDCWIVLMKNEDFAN